MLCSAAERRTKFPPLILWEPATEHWLSARLHVKYLEWNCKASLSDLSALISQGAEAMALMCTGMVVSQGPKDAVGAHGLRRMREATHQRPHSGARN